MLDCAGGLFMQESLPTHVLFSALFIIGSVVALWLSLFLFILTYNI
jgi:hypothetical protein